MNDFFHKCLNKIAPPANKSEDGRDAWGSRRSFILAAMGGAVGFGSLLRYPSIAYNNNGLQVCQPSCTQYGPGSDCPARSSSCHIYWL